MIEKLNGHCVAYYSNDSCNIAEKINEIIEVLNIKETAEEEKNIIPEMDDSDFVSITNSIYGVLDETLKRDWSLLEITKNMQDTFSTTQRVYSAWKNYIFKKFNKTYDQNKCFGINLKNRFFYRKLWKYLKENSNKINIRFDYPGKGNINLFELMNIIEEDYDKIEINNE